MIGQKSLIPRRPEIKKLTPHSMEIMRRLILGQKPGEIAVDLNMSAGQVKTIVQSPLFQLELRKKMSQRDEKISRVQEVLLDAAVAGAELHLQLIKGVMEVPTGEVDADGKAKMAHIIVPVQVSQKSATDVLHIFGRVNGRLSTKDEVDASKTTYEKVLREVIVREVKETQSSQATEDGREATNFDANEFADEPFTDMAEPPPLLGLVPEIEDDLEHLDDPSEGYFDDQQVLDSMPDEIFDQIATGGFKS